MQPGAQGGRYRAHFPQGERLTLTLTLSLSLTLTLTLTLTVTLTVTLTIILTRTLTLTPQGERVDRHLHTARVHAA